MFTGIISAIGEVRAVVKNGQEQKISLRTPFRDLTLGESVAVNGACLTVAEFIDGETIAFHLAPETVRRTNLGDLIEGSRVNLERALLATERLSGHIVQGHVDAVGELQAIIADGDSFILQVKCPADLLRYVVEKGSITIDGISLTVSKICAMDGIESGEFQIQIVPHTWSHTNLRYRLVGERINLEVDILAKYVEKLCRYQQPLSK